MTNLGMSHQKVTILELLTVAASCAAAAAYLGFDLPGRVIVVIAVLSGFIAGGKWVIHKERSQGHDST